MMPRRAPSKVRKTIIFNSYRSIRSRDRDTIVKESRSSRCRRRFCQTLSHFANPLDLCDQHFLLDMNFLGTLQLRAGVDILFFFKTKCLFFLNTLMYTPGSIDRGRTFSKSRVCRLFSYVMVIQPNHFSMGIFFIKDFISN
jgi:hypothetical protein